MTKIRLILASLALGWSVTSAAAQAAPTPASQPVGDSVSGTFTTIGFINQEIQWQISASSGPSGENPTGTISSVFREASFFDGTVTCLSVQDNVALVITRDANFGTPLAFRITDNAGLGVADLVETTFASEPATECEEPETSYIRTDRVTSGDITVVDAPPIPTSTDQCKADGWGTFGGTFKNQGQCVAFVQRGPKP